MTIPLWPARVEVSRCTGHCCDPVTIGIAPGDLRRQTLQGRAYPEDRALPDMLVWQGWRPPSRGGWPITGNHEYKCRHFDKEKRACGIYNQERPRMCTDYPEYRDGGPCEHPDCTRRTVPAAENRLRVLRGLD